MHMQTPRIIRSAGIAADPASANDHWTDRICTGYGDAMATRADGKTPNRVIRIDDETWAEYARVCEARGISRSDAVRLNIKREIAEFQEQERRIARQSGSKATS